METKPYSRHPSKFSFQPKTNNNTTRQLTDLWNCSWRFEHTILDVHHISNCDNDFALRALYYLHAISYACFFSSRNTQINCVNYSPVMKSIFIGKAELFCAWVTLADKIARDLIIAFIIRSQFDSWYRTMKIQCVFHSELLLPSSRRCLYSAFKSDFEMIYKDLNEFHEIPSFW